MPDYRETIIRISHEVQEAEVWTESAGLASRLKRLGFKETKQQGRGVWLKGHRKQISFRNRRNNKAPGPKRAIPEGLRKHQEAIRAAKREPS